ncbi:hypothetical protein EI555_011229, partial [Monodon monoceros]
RAGELEAVRLSERSPGRCAPAAPVPLIDDGREKWRRCLISPASRPPKLAPGNGPGAAGEAAPGGGEEPREGGRGAPGTMQWRPGRGRVRGLRLPKVSPGSSSLPPGAGTRSEEGRRCGGGDWRWGSERLLCWGAVSSSREENGAWCKSLLSHAVSSAFRRLPRPLRQTCLPPPKALSAPGFWRLPGVARPPSSVLLLITLVLYRIRVPFSPSLFSPLVF